MSSVIKYDVLFDITKNGIHCAIYTNSDNPYFDMTFDNIKHVELWITNIQRELLLAQLRNDENEQVNQRIKELEKRLGYIS